ncbi:hypothetical protein QJS10_CPA08g00507 [Acorus calamus]|uniref:Uncharacterized protein n=1 Tax=Acorus calamus TaxID=4465 RepID=A0AAV9EEJ4_ACOCL|nr:hypothetical protein QJS10_CPA08g00507 [Acorus calamus]
MVNPMVNNNCNPASPAKLIKQPHPPAVLAQLSKHVVQREQEYKNLVFQKGRESKPTVENRHPELEEEAVKAILEYTRSPDHPASLEKVAKWHTLQLSKEDEEVPSNASEKRAQEGSRGRMLGHREGYVRTEHFDPKNWSIPGECYGCFPETKRLEFLGDAVLDYLITVHLYNVYPGLSPGLLTDLRSASVNNNCYAHAAAKFGLNKHILHASSEFNRQMSDYFSKFGESFAGYSYGWEAGAALPKASLFTVLADVIESLAGAILVDSGFNKDVVWKSIRPLLEPLVSPDTIKYHPVRELGDICAKNSFRKTFTMSHENGIASITAEVEAEGTIYRETKTGKNKKEAKALAADAMLKSLKAGISCL